MPFNIGRESASKLFFIASRKFGDQQTGEIDRKGFAALTLALLEEKSAYKAAAQEKKLFGVIDTPQSMEASQKAYDAENLSGLTANLAIGGQQSEGYINLADISRNGKLDLFEFCQIANRDGLDGFSSNDFKMLDPFSFFQGELNLDEQTPDGVNNIQMLQAAANSGNDHNPLEMLFNVLMSFMPKIDNSSSPTSQQNNPANNILNAFMNMLLPQENSGLGLPYIAEPGNLSAEDFINSIINGPDSLNSSIKNFLSQVNTNLT